MGKLKFTRAAAKVAEESKRPALPSGKPLVPTQRESKVTLKPPRLQGYVAKRAPMDHESSGFARYGNGSSKGKRLSDEFSKSEPVSKRIRNKDAESDRQRRLGMGVAAAGLGSALLLRRGLGGARQTTRALRGIEVTPSAWKRQSDRARSLVNHVDAKGKPVRGNGIAFTREDLGATAGGTALGGSALGLEHYSRSRRNHRWE